MTLVEIIPAEEVGLFEVWVRRVDPGQGGQLEVIDDLTYSNAFDYASVLVSEGAVIIEAPW